MTSTAKTPTSAAPAEMSADELRYWHIVFYTMAECLRLYHPPSQCKDCIREYLDTWIPDRDLEFAEGYKGRYFLEDVEKIYRHVAGHSLFEGMSCKTGQRLDWEFQYGDFSLLRTSPDRRTSGDSKRPFPPLSDVQY